MESYNALLTHISAYVICSFVGMYLIVRYFFS